VLENSILLAKAKASTFDAVFAQPINRQIEAYRATLKDLDDFLDAGDLTKVTLSMMNVIKTDLLNIMTGLRQLQEDHRLEALAYVSSIDGVLAKLRTAKFIIFKSEDFFKGETLKPESKDAFFSSMEACQSQITEARKVMKGPSA
jgi:hypothetical protein